MAGELKVTQADIRVAADFYDAMGWRDVASALRGGFTPDAHDPGPFEALQALARYRIATETRVQATIDELVGALERCRNRFHRCIISGGTDEEYADAAVAEYDTILSRHKGEGQ